MSYANLTWDKVLIALAVRGPDGFSNRQLARALELTDNEAIDLDHLTRIMARAGAIDVEKRRGSLGVNVYRSKT